VPAKLCRRPEERPAVKIIAGSSQLLPAEPSTRGGRVSSRQKF